MTLHPRRMRPTRGRATAALLGVLAAATVASPAAASQSATAGSNKCTITALAPTLSGTNLTGRASVVCSMATTVTVEFGVVEMDSTLEDTKVPIPMASKSVAVKANTAVTINTATLTCLNTETGNEEYASKARVNLSGTVSAYDRTAPANDSYAC